MKTFRTLVFLTVLILAGCSAATRMTGTWRAYPDQSLAFNKIAIIGVTKNVEARKIIEASIEEKLLKNGINAVAGLEFLPPNAAQGNISPEVVKEFISLNGFDGVILVSLLGKEDTRRYVPGSYMYTPLYTTSFYDYYGQMNNYLYAPGYYTGSVNVFLETNLYQYPDGKLVWSGQSETTDISDLERSSDIFSDVIVSELVKNGVITP